MQSQRAAIATALCCALLVGGCATNDEPSDEEAQPSPKSSEHKAEPKPKPKPKPNGLTGFGATVADWESVRGPSVRGFAPGSVYGPVVRPGPGTHEYFGVLADKTVDEYSRGFPVGTNLTSAEQLVLGDFPPDAQITVRDTDEAVCTIVLIESDRVQQAVGSDAIAAFFSQSDGNGEADLDETDVSDAAVFPDFDGRRADLGFC